MIILVGECKHEKKWDVDGFRWCWCPECGAVRPFYLEGKSVDSISWAYPKDAGKVLESFKGWLDEWVMTLDEFEQCMKHVSEDFNIISNSCKHKNCFLLPPGLIWCIDCGAIRFTFRRWEKAVKIPFIPCGDIEEAYRVKEIINKIIKKRWKNQI